MKYQHWFILTLLCLLVVPIVSADNATFSGPMTLDPLLHCEMSAADMSSCHFSDGTFPDNTPVNNIITTYLWDGTTGNQALAGIHFQVLFDSLTSFTMETYGNESISGSIQVIYNGLISSSGIQTSTRILTLNGISYTTTTFDFFGGSYMSKFFISVYALNKTTNEHGIVLYNSGLFEEGVANFTQTPGKVVQMWIPDENIFVPFKNVASYPVRSITVTSDKPYNINIYSANAGKIAHLLQTQSQSMGVVQEPFEAYTTVATGIAANSVKTFELFSDYIIQLLLKLPYIIVLYEVIAPLLAWYETQGIISGLVKWWGYQKKLVSFATYGLTVIEKHWQAFSIGGAIIILGKIAGYLYSYIHFWSAGAI